jgi:hypothetical protein
MLKSSFLDHFKDSNWKSEIDFLNSFNWNITLHEIDGRWIALGGDQTLVAASSEEERDAFILGMTIALIPLPESIHAEIRKLAPAEE